jgi:tRNA threonylcarbamoyladenosine biosynthesis protein TsaE
MNVELNTINESARRFISLMGNQTVFAFHGEMGAGKTTFIKALCEELGVTDVINSPTFAIINEYRSDTTGELIYHFDFYRLGGEEELFEIGWDEYPERGGVIAAEWSENAPGAFSDDTIRVHITATGDTERSIAVEDPRA